MGKIVVMNHVSLDGVMQGPGRADEDTDGGFTQGGWGNRTPNLGDAMGMAMGRRMESGGGLAGWLFGRRTYDDLLSHWTKVPDAPFGQMLLGAQKFVPSTTLSEPLPWPNTTLLTGNVVGAVQELKETTEGILGIMGSSQLISSLLAADLIDEYLLAVHPLVLGNGKKLFPEKSEMALRLIDSTTTDEGVFIATYEPIREQ